MKKKFVALLLLILIPFTVSAGFSGSFASLHPHFPATGPFIIEISGTWPTDCHPGEQKPVVESYDGHDVKIGFEIIIVHVTCNTIDTDFRVLVDMSQLVQTTRPVSDSLNIQASFQGDSFEQSVDLYCPENWDCTVHPGDQVRPEKGLYDSPHLLNQGLLVARQNGAMGIFPLVYDEFGGSEWLFSGNHMIEDSFFTEVMRPGGGDCFGCDPGNTEPELTTIGYLTVLVDQPGVLQVKFNDGLFTEYQRTVYGYNTLPVGENGEYSLVDLEGRWGISENWGTNPPLGDLTELLPGAFDIVLENKVMAEHNALPGGQVSFLVSAPTGETLGQLVCDGQTTADGRTNVCEFIDETDQADPLFRFYQEGPSSLSIEYTRPIIDVGIAPGGKAVRLD